MLIYKVLSSGSDLVGRNQDKGNQYENFVELVYKALLGAEQNHPDIKNITVVKL